MAQRFVRLLFDFTCSFDFMINVYCDVNLFKLFSYVSTYFCLPIGRGTHSHQDDGGLQQMEDIWRRWGTLKIKDTMVNFVRIKTAERGFGGFTSSNAVKCCEQRYIKNPVKHLK